MLVRKLVVFTLISFFLGALLSARSGRSAAAADRFIKTSHAPATGIKHGTRRALLIAIENYEHDPEFRPTKCEEAVGRSIPRKAGRRSTARNGFITLDGPMNDVCSLRQLLLARYGFEARNIHIVANQEATREGIQTAFKRYMIDEVEPGDFCLFYYSGHGSQVKNTLGGEVDQMDETIVPIDWKRPITKREDAKDIRDKEIFKLFRQAAQKVTLTALFDSCHSGGISRGGITEGGRARTGPSETTFDFAEPPPDKDQEGVSDQEYLEKSGVLVISAARDDQKAEENEYNHQMFGNFTYALLEVLQSPNANNLPAARIFDKVVVQMKSHHDPHEPVIVGSPERRRNTLFGEPVDPSRRLEVQVESVDKGVITLQGGRALGLNEGCELARKAPDGHSGEVRIRITQKPDFVKSVAEVVEVDSALRLRLARTVKPNDTFVLEKWAATGEPNLIVWMPTAKLSAAQLQAAAQEIETLAQSSKVQLVNDPTVEMATHFLFHDGTSWVLKLPDHQTVKLGPALDGKAVLAQLTGDKAKLFYSLPPSAEFVAQLKLGDGTVNSAVSVTRTPQDADYWLIGRVREARSGTLEYAWLLPEATVGMVRANDETRGNIKITNAGANPLPAITDWKLQAVELEDQALRLGKIRGWLRLDSAEGDSSFAYRLVLRNEKNEVISAGNATLAEGDKFFIYLVADESLLQKGLEQRHVYVFNIDGAGRTTLFFPYLRGNQADTLVPSIPPSGLPPREIKLVDKGLLICGPDKEKSHCRSVGVLGPETYVMLSTVEALPDPLVIESDGVRTSEEVSAKSRGMKSPLQDLLMRLGSTSRSGGMGDATPVNWSVQRVFFQSVAKKS